MRRRMSSPGSVPSSPTSHLSSPSRPGLLADNTPLQASASAANLGAGSIGSGSLDDVADGTLEVDRTLEPSASMLLREACMSESTALAVAVTDSVDGLLAQRSDLDCAAREVDVERRDEPLSGVRSAPACRALPALLVLCSACCAPACRAPAAVHLLCFCTSRPRGACVLLLGLRRARVNMRASHCVYMHACGEGDPPWCLARVCEQVMSPRGQWSLFRGNGGSSKPEARPAKIHSFDALMTAPQGCPVSVRMQRDTAARQQSQPLFNFFKNALGLNSNQNKDGNTTHSTQPARCVLSSVRPGSRARLHLHNVPRQRGIVTQDVPPLQVSSHWVPGRAVYRPRWPVRPLAGPLNHTRAVAHAVVPLLWSIRERSVAHGGAL
jgi:hypothetical protein